MEAFVARRLPKERGKREGRLYILLNAAIVMRCAPLLEACLARAGDADFSDRAPGSRTPAHSVAVRGDAACMRVLLARGADPLRKDGDGRTPLDVARALGPKGAACTAAIIAHLRARERPLTLQQLAWSAARRARLIDAHPAPALVPPVIARQNRRWEADRPWEVTPDDLD